MLVKEEMSTCPALHWAVPRFVCCLEVINDSDPFMANKLHIDIYSDSNPGMAVTINSYLFSRILQMILFTCEWGGGA